MAGARTGLEALTEVIYSDRFDEYSSPEAAKLIENLLAQKGFFIVPKEPTPKMLDDGLAAYTNIRDIWDAMLAAAQEF